MYGKYGKLEPVRGGDPIPLRRNVLLIGRRECCDIVLRFRNVSASHAQLRVIDGYWYVCDLKSTNGVKVNGKRVQEKRLDPGDVVSFAKHAYKIDYAPVELGAVGSLPPDIFQADVFDKSLMQQAGLDQERLAKVKQHRAFESERRYKVNIDGEDSGIMRMRKRPT